MIVAGIGCRRGCLAEAIVALVREAGPVDVLAAPTWKQEEAGLLEAARLLGLPVRWIARDALAAVQELCVTRSAVVAKAVGLAAVAEAAALAGGGALLRARFGQGGATCALALEQGTAAGRWAPNTESPPPLEGGAELPKVPRVSSACGKAAEGRGGVQAALISRVATPPPSPLPQGEGEPCSRPNPL